MSTSVQSRANILKRLRAGIGESPALIRENDIGRTASYSWTEQERLAHFSQLMSAVKTEIHQTTEQNWPRVLENLLRVKGISSLLVSSKKETGQRLAEINPGFTLRDVPEDPLSMKSELFFDIPASLTTCRGAIAETGSLVLWPDAHEPRAMSLVPPVHFVLLKACDMHDTFADVLRAKKWNSGMPTNALLISGPSKTADIARILAYGAHGPRELIVLLVE